MRTTHNEQEKGFKTLTLDIDYYQSFLDDPDLSEDQKHEFIERWWALIVQFVDMGWGIEATQLARAASKLERSDTTLIDTFGKAVSTDNERILEKEGIG